MTPNEQLCLVAGAFFTLIIALPVGYFIGLWEANRGKDA